MHPGEEEALNLKDWRPTLSAEIVATFVLYILAKILPKDKQAGRTYILRTSYTSCRYCVLNINTPSSLFPSIRTFNLIG
jgi:hypothetical protein